MLWISSPLLLFHERFWCCWIGLCFYLCFTRGDTPQRIRLDLDCAIWMGKGAGVHGHGIAGLLSYYGFLIPADCMNARDSGE